MISRKTFLKQSVLFAAGSTRAAKIGERFLRTFDNTSVTILYTNDTHSRIDPFPPNAREFAGLGGIAKRSSLVKKIRSETKNVLLLDAGDVFQGTRWFEVYGGKVDLQLMTKMGYDAMAIGEHEFDRGLDGFAEAAKFAGFPFLDANYTTEGTPINPFVKQYLIKEFDGFRIGIFGLGIRLEGIVDPALSGDVKYRNPVFISKRLVNSLRDFHQCDYVICLSHLGFRYEGDQIDDVTLAQTIAGIDLIIGGHTHTFLDEPVFVENPDGRPTIITQMGHSGIRLGRIDLAIGSFSTQSTPFSHQYYTIGKDE